MNKLSKTHLVELKNKTDIPRLLQHLGVYFVGRSACCPYHGDENPSATINENGIYCYVCEESFDSIDIIMAVENCSFNEAENFLQTFVDELQDFVEVDFEKKVNFRETGDHPSSGKHITEKDREILKYFFSILALSASGLQYLTDRGMTPEIISKYHFCSVEDPDILKAELLKKYTIDELLSCGLMNISKNRNPYFTFFRHCILIPFFDEEGDPIYLIARNLFEKPKYLKLCGITQPEFKGREFDTSEQIFCFEGPFDGIAYEILSGNSNYYVFMGLPGVTKYGELMKKYPDKKFVLALDNDERGAERTEEIVNAYDNVSALDWEIFLSGNGVPENVPIKDINDLLIYLRKEMKND
ncbi:MAG TPA: CHC2 zinc finger domain-containing protein [bacterium]|nr:CHC2 zinc finger domain-containing protein [bacterium]